MKQLITILLLLLPLMTLGQGTKSEDLYNKGMQLFNAKQYEKAIPYFQKSDSLHRAQLAPTSENYYRAKSALAECCYQLSMEKFYAQKYSEAIKFENMASNLYKEMGGDEDPNYVAAQSMLAIFNAKAGNYAEAIKHKTIATEISKKTLGEDNPKHALSLSTLALYNSKIDNYEEAVRLETVALDIYKKALGETNPDYIASLNNLAIYNAKIGNHTETIRLKTIALDIYKNTMGENTFEYVNSLEQIAVCNAIIDNYTESIRLGTKATQIWKNLLGDEHPDYAKSLSNLANYNDVVGNRTEAIRLETIASEIYLKSLGEEDPDYISSLNHLAFYNDEIGNHAEAIRLKTMVVNLYKKTLGETHQNYLSSLDYLAYYNGEMGNYAEAIRVATMAMQIRKKVLGDEHPEYATSLSNLVYYYDNNGNYTKAINLATMSATIRKKVLGEGHPDYVKTLNDLATINAKMGNYTEAIRLGTIVMETDKKTLGDEHPDYATSLNNLASYNANIGNYTEAIRLATMALKIWKKIVGDEHPDYAAPLNNLATYQARIDNYTEAIRLGSMAMEIWKKTLGEEHPDYAASLRNLAGYNFAIGNYTEAISLETKALEIRKKVLGKEHPLYAESLSDLASEYAAMENIPDAIRLATMAMQIRKKTLGEEHPDYARSLMQLAYYNFYIVNDKDAVKYFKQYYKSCTTFILKNFASMTNEERTNYWNMYSDFFINTMTNVAYRQSVDPSYNDRSSSAADIAALAYDGQVLSKGLLLNTELEIQKLIEQSNDTTFANLYYKIKQDRVALDKQYQLAPEERTIDVDSLSKILDDEERRLMESSKALGDYTKNLAINWRDIQKQLRKGDLAVEFANFKDTSKQDFYVALVLKKGMKSPKIVKLFESDDFGAINDSNYYNTPKLYNLVWKPLEPYLKGVTNVYFSPSGRFHTIGLESLPDESGKIFAEKYDSYRLSSTRELALPQFFNPDKKAATYGGIKYNFTEEDWQNIKDNADSQQRSFQDSPQIDENLRGGGGGGVQYLMFTRDESNAVADLLSAADYDVYALSDDAATEESFKNFSGTGLQILHIGTHGFYQTEEDLENAGRTYFINALQQSQEDRSLSCSGLLFAGVNSALDNKRNNEIPEGFDDGILTAKEISRLDFCGLDLVVLSACQTGLGEITGEGVFGLQRGFKKAGAQTIIMSLWKVNDDSTQLLMTEFFQNLTSGLGKRASFTAAQSAVRAKFPNPVDWAAFVMVDALD